MMLMKFEIQKVLEKFELTTIISLIELKMDINKFIQDKIIDHTNIFYPIN